MAALPRTMRSLVAPRYGWPTSWEVTNMPIPAVVSPKDVLIKIHAGGIATGDTQLARGAMRYMVGDLKFPHKIGIEAAGVVVKVGSGVTLFKPGDKVYAFGVSRPMNFTAEIGFCSEYAVAQENLTLAKPINSSFEDVCDLGNITTALQSIEIGLQLMRENGVTDGLEGKTVFVSGGLSATGSVAIQMLKNVYRVGKIITTVSTAKVPLVEKYLPGLVDQVVDYTRVERLADAIPPGSVDLVYNTQWILASTFPLVKPDVGVVVSITGVPTPGLLHVMLPPMPFLVYWLAGLAQLWYKFKLRGTNVKYQFHSGNPGAREDLDRAGEMLAIGKIKTVKRVVELEDIEAVRREAQKVATGKGGIGKLVIKIAE
ncbi:GroES-like protein [Daldinia caldariorum]|uniref:GroES-like protein n=1 Tax=Daldinia caldariorum TaxID=326644 RepID=UPI0020077A43|nr:GroES-like protein [Daldinia caldariorum]KAI1465290.1 GroES-like protein [Daldinia caldariorum]